MEVSDLSTGTDNLSLSEMDISLSDDNTTPKVDNDTNGSLEDGNATEPMCVLLREKYHAFLAHSNTDAKFVESIMDTLEKRGISCCYSKRDFRLGTSTVSCINEALDRSKFVICFLSKDFLTSPWCKHERELALHKAAETSEDIVVPILMDASVEDLPLNIRRLTHIRREDIDFEKLFSSLGFPEGNSRPTYIDLETANAELKTKLEDAQIKLKDAQIELEDAQKLIKIKDDALIQQQMHIKQCEDKVSQHESAMAAMKLRCHDLQQRLDRRDAELKEMKTKLDHCLNEDENKQQQMSDSALTTTVEDLPEKQIGDIQTDPTLSLKDVQEFHCRLGLAQKRQRAVSPGRYYFWRRRDAKVKEMKTKLDHCLNEKAEIKQQQMSDSAVKDLPKMQMGDIQTVPTLARNGVKEFRRLLKLGENYGQKSSWQDVINTLKGAERIVKENTNNSIPESMVFEMFRCLWKAYRNLKDYQTSINYCNEALSYQHKLFGPGCVNLKLAQC
ncbi:uncharacterized protein LOC106170997 isoform X2 [Lingula anatina]|nr:uncharacterized protein LOC106170997 isoform X2 [Lingula anatina]|eukprot:XP_013406542.1 uncharacterized protein LOC106170997 isoform X2 [Lingula anatina]